MPSNTENTETFHEFDLSSAKAFGGECQQKEKFHKLAKSLMADFKSPRELVLVSFRVANFDVC